MFFLNFQNPVSGIISSCIVTVIYQFIFFVISASLKTDKLTDWAGVSNIALLAVLSLVNQHHVYDRQIIATVMVVVWALWLAPFLLYRILHIQRDWRLDQFRGSTVKLAFLWTMQGFWAVTQVLPVLLLNTHSVSRHNKLHPWTTACTACSLFWIGVFALGWIIQAVSDWQKFQHRQSGSRRWLDTGLWKYSRHPNYFGEWLMWIAIYMYCKPDLNMLYRAIALISPFTAVVALLFFTGIPLIEWKANKEFCRQNEYLEFKRSTSPVIPMPPGLYRSLPTLAKRVLLMDYPLYWRHLAPNAMTQTSGATSAAVTTDPTKSS